MNSEIRERLNDGFLKTAFNLDSSLIQTTTVDNSASTTYSSNNKNACADTEDKIYLLSYQDYKNANYGFSSDDSRTCKTTDYARVNGISYSTSSSYYGNGCYWTRSPSGVSESAWIVRSDSILNPESIFTVRHGVRPALTINL